MWVQAGVGKLSPSENLDEYRCCYSKDKRNMNKNIQLFNITFGVILLMQSISVWGSDRHQKECGKSFDGMENIR